MELGKPSLYISQQVNGNSDYVASLGEALHYEIYFKNVGEEALSDMFLAVKLQGDGFNYDSLKAPKGSFRKGDNSVVFDSRDVTKLNFLDTGKEGKVEFWIDVKEDWQPETGKPELTNQVLLGQAQEEFTTVVSSGLQLNQVGYFENEVFHNTGPIPPEVGKSTEYVVMWKPELKFGRAKDVKIKSELPDNVEFTGKAFPEEQSSKFNFNSETRELTWDLGTIGGTSTIPNISFQVELTPNSSQKGSTPTIIKEAEITGVDPLTETKMNATSSAVDTTLSEDSDSEGEVQ